jgi:hypothetical protein
MHVVNVELIKMVSPTMGVFIYLIFCLQCKRKIDIINTSGYNITFLPRKNGYITTNMAGSALPGIHGLDLVKLNANHNNKINNVSMV